jgi:hypothetical protein
VACQLFLKKRDAVLLNSCLKIGKLLIKGREINNNGRHELIIDSEAQVTLATNQVESESLV